MKIIQLEATNVKRLSAVRITPEGSLVVIGGNNAQGKSSVLDSIAYALGGMSEVCARPVRAGQSGAKIVCTLDEMVVTRTFTAKGGGTLAITSPDGKAKFSSPQGLLDALVGKLTFDPLAFLHMKPAEQLATLKAIIGLDFAKADADRRNWYEERTAINRDIKANEATLATLPEFPDALKEEISISDLTTSLHEAHAHNEGVAELKRAALDIESRADEAAEAIVALERTAADAEEQFDAATAEAEAFDPASMAAHARSLDERRENAVAEIQKWQRVLESIDQERDQHRNRMGEYERANHAAQSAHTLQVKAVDDLERARAKAFQNRAAADAAVERFAAVTPRDTASIEAEIASAETVNQKVRRNQARAITAKRIAELREQSSGCTAKIEEIDARKAKTIADARLPVDGLAFGESGVTFRDVPFEQCSSAEQLRISVAMGLAQNPKLKVLLVRDGSLLDADGLRMVAEMAEAADAQVWIERVGEGAECQVIIKDGCVKGVNDNA